MKEEIIISGRNLPHIDPVLEIWEWPIPTYLFLGGLSAGLLFFAAFYFLKNKANEYPTTVKFAPIIAPFAIVLGLIALIYDLKHPLYFWRLMTTIRLESPMSWGAWTLTLIMPVSVLWVMSYMKETYANIDLKRWYFKPLALALKPTEGEAPHAWTWKYTWLDSMMNLVTKQRSLLAWAQLILAIVLGVYTGILLSAFNARPLWNVSILGPLFLVSGFSTAAAAITWMAKSHNERKTFMQIDLVLIAIELFFITHLFMGFLAGPEVQVAAAELFLGGEFTVSFWVLVVGFGLVIPAVLDIFELKGYHIPVAIPALMVLIGGLIFRFIMVDAGQITRFLY